MKRVTDKRRAEIESGVAANFTLDEAKLLNDGDPAMVVKLAVVTARSRFPWARFFYRRIAAVNSAYLVSLVQREGEHELTGEVEFDFANATGDLKSMVFDSGYAVSRMAAEAEHAMASVIGRASRV